MYNINICILYIYDVHIYVYHSYIACPRETYIQGHIYICISWFYKDKLKDIPFVCLQAPDARTGSQFVGEPGVAHRFSPCDSSVRDCARPIHIRICIMINNIHNTHTYTERAREREKERQRERERS